MKKFTGMRISPKSINENDQQSQLPESTIDQSMGQESHQSTPVKFFSKLFESKEMAHVYHLQVKGDDGSHATHVALGVYYEEAPNMIDELIEVYMGQYDVVEGYDIIDTNVSRTLDPLEYFMGVGEFIKSERYQAIQESDTHLHSIIDEIANLVYRLTYKLKYNK
jgi:hypothetical protein